MRPILCFVVDRSATRRPILEVVDAAVRAGVDWVQVRDRSLDTNALLVHAREVAETARRAARESGREVSVLVNRRVDIALALPAEGVHLGGDALPPAEARALLGPRARIGVSAHTPLEVERASENACDYVHLAPIFDPLSKPAERAALGLSALAEASRAGLPVLAQGGVTAEHGRKILATGAAGIAVTGAISLADDPGAAAASLRRALGD